MKELKRLGAVMLAALVVVGLAACGGTGGSSDSSSNTASGTSDSAVSNIVAAGKVVWVTNAEFAPLEFKEGNEIVGIDADIAAKIAEDLGVELEPTDIAFDACIPSITEGRADFCAAGMTVTEDRLRNVDFTDTYFNASQVIIVPMDSEIKSAEDLNGKKVGVQQGTTGDLYVTNEDGENDIECEVSRYPKGMDAVSDLVAGRLDAVVIDDFPAKKLVANNSDKVMILDTPLTEEEYAIAVPKGSDLKDRINSVIESLKESGELDEIFSKYIDAE